jgi:FkbM family methyltransferase
MTGVRSVVDIGANRGQFALVARHCFPDASIISFEPLPGPAVVYRSALGSDPLVTLREVAIGPRSGEALMFVSGRDDSSSLLPISEEQERIFPGTASVGTQRIVVTSLAEQLIDSQFKCPALLKIDVQGFELDVLRASEDVVDRFNWLYVECSFLELYKGQASADQVIAWLRLRGFLLEGTYNVSYDNAGRAIQADMLFGRGKPS